MSAPSSRSAGVQALAGGGLAGNPIERRLEAMLQAGRQAWPGLDVGAEVFGRYVTERVASALDPIAAMEALEAQDLYLACACAQGLAEAIGAFERSILPVVTAGVRRIDPSPAFLDEVQQQLREKLFV